MSKFTNGPWIMDGNGFSNGFNISNSEYSICNVVSEADARLIAAAPELLEALNYWYQYGQDVNRAALTKSFREELKERSKLTLRIIMKAEGKIK